MKHRLIIRSIARLWRTYAASLKYRVKPRTLAGYEHSFNRIAKALALRRPADCSLLHIEGYVHQRKEAGAKDRTVNAEVGALKRLLAWSAERRYIARNPLERWNPLPERDRDSGRALTVAEARALLNHDHAVNRYAVRQPCRHAALWRFLLRTGARPSEAVALDFDDIDHARKRVRLGRKGKTAASDRYVPLTDDLAGTLQPFDCPSVNAARASFARCLAAAGLAGGGSSPVHLLTRSSANQQSTISNLRLYSLRYTFATWLIAPPDGRPGSPPGVVQRLMGHRRVETTLAIYAKVGNADLAAAIASLGEISLVAQASCPCPPVVAQASSPCPPATMPQTTGRMPVPRSASTGRMPVPQTASQTTGRMPVPQAVPQIQDAKQE